MAEAEVRTCFKCSKERSLSSRFCESCGADLGPGTIPTKAKTRFRTRRCPNPACGNVVPLFSARCLECGQELRLASGRQTATTKERDFGVIAFSVVGGVLALGIFLDSGELSYLLLTPFVLYLFARFIKFYAAGSAESAETHPNRARRPTMPSSKRFAVLARDNYTCQYCGRKPPDVTLQIDHRLPFSLGGTDELRNLVTACSECNGGKSNNYVT